MSFFCLRDVKMAIGTNLKFNRHCEERSNLYAIQVRFTSSTCLCRDCFATARNDVWMFLKSEIENPNFEIKIIPHPYYDKRPVRHRPLPGDQSVSLRRQLVLR